MIFNHLRVCKNIFYTQSFTLHLFLYFSIAIYCNRYITITIDFYSAIKIQYHHKFMFLKVLTLLTASPRTYFILKVKLRVETFVKFKMEASK